MSQKTIAVLGATGVQGGSVIQALLKDKSWKIRGITRDTSKDAAKVLEKQSVEVVSANIDDEGSLLKAFEVSQLLVYHSWNMGILKEGSTISPFPQ